MSKTLKIFLTILVFGIIVFGGASVQATEVRNATEIQEVLGEENSEVSGDTVKLKDNITLTVDTMNFNSGTAILDLNGKTLTLAMSCSLFNISGGNLTVKDSTETTGKITHNGINDIFHLYTQGKLTIENGIFNSVNSSIIGIDSDDEENTVPTVIIKNGTFTTKRNNCIWGYAGDTTIHNGNFETLDSGALYFDSDNGNMNVTINDCEVISKYDNIYISGGNLTIQDGKFTSSQDNNIEIDNEYNYYGANNEIIINGGTYSTTGSIVEEEASCVYIDMFDDEEYPMDVIINGGTFTAEEGAWDGITLKQGNLEINGGTFTSKSECGVQAYKGILEINGGNFLGKWSGLWYDSLNTDVTLKGGRYESLATVSEDNYGGIHTDINKNVKPTENLATGYELYEDATIVEYDGCYCTKSPVTIELHRYNIKVNKSENGTVTFAKGYASKNEIVTITTTPIKDYKLKSITVTTKSGANVEVSNNKFTMPEEEVVITAEFEHIYSEEIITKTEGSSTVSIKGTFSGNPKLVITKTEEGNDGYNSLITLVKEDEKIIGSYDVSIEGGEYTGKLELTFTVGKQYEGDVVTIYHQKANEEVETKTATVKNGKVTIIIEELSPFMLVIDKEVVEEKDTTPKTGTYQFTGISILIIGLSVLGITKIKKRK